jgi:tetrahydromethanopterin S-methyltransferase subunit B
MTHECTQKDNISDIKKILYGNSRPGLIQDMTMITTQMESLTETVNKMDANLERALTYMYQTEGAKNYKTKVISKNQFLWGTILTFAGVIIALLAFIFTKS